jgi:phosphohistidine swiveling domain-containing protein
VVAGRALYDETRRGLRGHGTGGKARGPVVHVRDDDVLPPMTPGAPPPVLVAATLTPALSYLLDLAAAVVLVHGGPLSHAAIQARERGLPALLGVAGALTLAEGVEVLVDADEGVVCPLGPDSGPGSRKTR